MEKAKASRRAAERGQTTTEYAMVISVIAVGLALVTGYLLRSDGPWAEGNAEFNSRLGQQVQQGWIGGDSAP